MAKTIDILINVRTTQFNKGIDKANAKLSTLNKTTGRILRTMSAFAALFIARAFARGMVETVKFAGDLQLQMIQIGRVSGVTGKALQGMREDLLNLSTSIVASIDELAELSIMAGRAGINTREGMLEIAKAASMMGNVTDMTAVEATNALIKISKAMDLPIGDAQKLGSVIVGVAKDFAASESEIVQAMLRMVGSGHMLGATAPELTVLSAMTIELGQNARRAGMVWNRSFFQMGKNMEKAAEIMGVSTSKLTLMIEKDFIGTIMELLKKIAEIPTKAGRLEKVREIFQMVGARGVALLVNRVDELHKAIDKANKQFDKGTELTTDYEKVLVSFNSQAKLLRDSFRRLKVAVGEELLPSVEKGIRSLKTSVEELAIAIETVGLAEAMADALRKQVFKGLEDLPTAIGKAVGFEAKIEALPTEDLTNTTEKINEEITTLQDNLFNEQLEQERTFWSAKADAIIAGTDIIKPILTQFGDWQKEMTLQDKMFLIQNEMEKVDTILKSNALMADSEAKLFKRRRELALAYKNLWIEVSKTIIGTSQELLGGLREIFEMAQGETKKFAGIIKTIRIAESIMDTAAAVMRTLATYGGTPLGWGMAAAVGAIGATKTALIAAQPFQRGGIVPGMGRGDRVPALLEPGELVVPRKEVKNFYNNAHSTVNVSMAGAFVMDDPNAVEKLYREYIRDKVKDEIRTGRDIFY